MVIKYYMVTNRQKQPTGKYKQHKKFLEENKNVISVVYGFWLPLWYLQTLLISVVRIFSIKKTKSWVKHDNVTKTIISKLYVFYANIE
jgi:hypothetical protein